MIRPRTPADTVGEWVAKLDGRVVGQVLLRQAADPPSWMVEAELSAPDFVIVSRLFVAPGGRNRGLAEKLLQTAWAEVEQRGLRPVLDVHHRNHAAPFGCTNASAGSESPA